MLAVWVRICLLQSKWSNQHFLSWLHPVLIRAWSKTYFWWHRLRRILQNHQNNHLRFWIAGVLEVSFLWVSNAKRDLTRIFGLDSGAFIFSRLGITLNPFGLVLQLSMHVETSKVKRGGPSTITISQYSELEGTHTDHERLPWPRELPLVRWMCEKATFIYSHFSCSLLGVL